MSRKVIAVDLDDVLSDTVSQFLQFCNEHWGMSLTPEDYNEHLATMWQVDEYEADKRIKEYHESGVASNYQYDEAAFEVLKKLSEDYDLVITTSRRRHLEEMTRAWLEKHYGGLFKDVRFAGIWDSEDKINRMNMTKAALCKEINASYLIDDQPKHCIAAAEAGLRALLFGSYPWNRQFEPTNGVTRVCDWKEIEEYFYGRG